MNETLIKYRKIWGRAAMTAVCLAAAFITGPVSAQSRDMEVNLTMADPQDPGGWYAGFGDETLDSLIWLAENNNLDLAQAMRNMERARQAVKEAKSGYYPQIDLGLGWERMHTSGRTTRTDGLSATQQYLSAGLTMSWEIDLFGRVTQKVREQQAAYRASADDYRWMCVSIAAETATYYMELRTSQAEYKVTSEHIEQQAKVMEITEARYETGLASKLDVAQARTVYYSTKASLLPLETQIKTYINAIAVLTGRFPAEMQAWLGVPEPQPRGEWTGDLVIDPELLRRRPDVMEAEATMEEYAAALGYEKKQWLPALALTASAGTEAWRLKDLFGKESYYYSVAPQLSWTVFDGLARDAATAAAREQLMAATDAYTLALLTAAQEADNALTSYRQAVKYEQEIAIVLENAQLAYTLALDRYRQGLDAFINVSDALMTVLEYANELVTARGNVLTSLIALQKSLTL